jgi:hypothetical protein
MSLFYPGFYPGLGRVLIPWMEAVLAGAAVWRASHAPIAAAR